MQNINNHRQFRFFLEDPELFRGRIERKEIEIDTSEEPIAAFVYSIIVPKLSSLGESEKENLRKNCRIYNQGRPISQRITFFDKPAPSSAFRSANIGSAFLTGMSPTKLALAYPQHQSEIYQRFVDEIGKDRFKGLMARAEAKGEKGLEAVVHELELEVQNLEGYFLPNPHNYPVLSVLRIRELVSFIEDTNLFLFAIYRNFFDRKSLPELEELRQELGDRLSIKEGAKFIRKWFEGNKTKLAQICNIRVRQAITSLPPEIKLFTNLKVLIIENVKVTFLPAEIGELSSLKMICVRETQIDSLPVEFTKLRSLKIVTLTKNKFKKIPDEILLLDHIEKIDMGWNYIKEFPTNLPKSLNRLYLNYNPIKDLSSDIVWPEGLIFLDLDFTNITSIPEKLRKLSTLQNVYLSGTKLFLIPEEIHWPALQYLSIKCSALVLIPRAILEHPKLESVGISRYTYNRNREAIHRMPANVLRIWVKENPDDLDDDRIEWIRGFYECRT